MMSVSRPAKWRACAAEPQVWHRGAGGERSLLSCVWVAALWTPPRRSGLSCCGRSWSSRSTAHQPSSEATGYGGWVHRRLHHRVYCAAYPVAQLERWGRPVLWPRSREPQDLHHRGQRLHL